MLNHKLLCCACFLLLLAASGSANEPEPAAELVKHINQQNLDGAGQYRHEIEIDNGIRTSAQGNVNGVQGEYDLPGENGPIHVTYTADSTGFHPHVN
ncbi:pupal cuticle protein Edg-78E [Drosophila montana]|uniref:pupal cuticle protein Edg-78E n=1 Tax=Drosophila montana TaxID=40370 RepID=UPI00313D9309